MLLQFIIINECIWRNRRAYEFLAYIDRDEFIHVNGLERKDVDLAAILHEHLDSTNFASASLHSALYPVACGRTRLPVIDQRHEGSLVQPSLIEDYTGYNVWAPDPRQPDFLNCSSDIAAHIFKPPGRQCHTKSIVRPLLVDYMLTHYVAGAVEGHEAIPKPLPTDTVYLKHVRCHPRGSDMEAPCQQPVDYAINAMDGVEVCPQNE